MPGYTLLSLCFLASAFIFPGCTVFDPPAARPGISHREAGVLTKYYYWRPPYPVPSYTEEALDALLFRSADPTLDGEYAEGQMSTVVIALAVIGDEKFAAALSRQSPEVLRAVSHDISYLWTKFELSYPRTQALLQ